MTRSYRTAKHKARVVRNNQSAELATAVPAWLKTGPDGSLVIILDRDSYNRLDNPGDDWYPPDGNHNHYRLIVD